MLKKFFRVYSLILAFLLSSYIVAFANNMIPLFKYKTKTPILLHGKQVSLPSTLPNNKRQFRGVWISTVANIDFPSKPGLSEKEFKSEFLSVLDYLQSLNINAVIFQVRPMNDAFYKSSLNPWSQYLTGKQGKDPGWDPLKWMIDETHKRNMEFHAWLNPYRVAQGFSIDKPTEQVKKEELSKFADNNFAKRNPQYVLRFANKLFLNPAEPAVQNFIRDTVVEIVKNYDVDAIHFDDYFYPYNTSKIDSKTGKRVPLIFGEDGEDTQSFEVYGKGYDDIKSWRRNNVDKMIKSVSDAIKKQKPHVKFGVSPFGIWGHYDNHPKGSIEGEGSHTPVTSQSSYDDIYADTRKWVKEGWIDYIIPQIYWAFATNSAPYAELVDWWADVTRGTKCQLYIGHGIYKYTESPNDVDWQNPEEILNQLKFNSLYKEVQGSAFFSLRYLRKNTLKTTDVIKRAFSYKALVPTMPWIKGRVPNTVTNIKVIYKNKQMKITFSDSKSNNSNYYVIYRFDGNKLGDINNPRNIIAIVNKDLGKTSFKYLDKTADYRKTYTYAVSAVDRLHNESQVKWVVYRKK